MTFFTNGFVTVSCHHFKNEGLLKMTVETVKQSELELASKRAWDALYGKTDELIWGDEPLEFIRTAFDKISSFLPDTPEILDAATGEGRNLPLLLERAETVTACDSSPHALEKLRARFPRRVETTLCDLEATEFENDRFDVILACDVIETLPNLSEVLAEFHRILRPGGFLIGNVPDNRDGIAGQDMTRIDTDEYLYQNRFFFRFQGKVDFQDFLAGNGLEPFDDFSATWTEEAHPEYRSERHSHTSQVIIARKY